MGPERQQEAFPENLPGVPSAVASRPLLNAVPPGGEAESPASAGRDVAFTRADSGGSPHNPGLARYDTAYQVPWERSDYTREEMVRWLTYEQQEIKKLFEHPLKPDTPIQRFMIQRPPATLTFKDVSFSLVKPDGQRVTILEPCSGHFEAGELVALMGPSGCGKSTLLDMLANKKTAKYEGQILVNGHKRDHLFQRVAAYVGQEDVMPQHWTVREAVEFNTRLKAPSLGNVPAEFAKTNMDITLAAFGLSGVANTFIGGPKVRGCSGGQRRRVTLARGVAQRSSMIFADEPTSGLSATDAELCIKALRIIAKKAGILIIVVIHQPRVEVAQLFDKLVLLTASPGRMVYFGSMASALSYWKEVGHPVPEHSNPTDFFLDLITPGGPLDHVDEFVAYFRENRKPAIDADVDTRMQVRGLTVAEMLRAHHRQQQAAHMNPAPLRETALAVPFPQQVAILFQRKMILTMRNSSAIIMPIVVPILVGILMGVMYYKIGKKAFQQQISFVFMLLVRICMGGMQLMPQLIEDRMIMKYDTSEGLYSVPAFILVGMSIDITLSLIGAFLNVTIMYAFSQLDWTYFPVIVGWAVLNFFVFDSFFGMLAAAAPNLQVAQVAAIPFNSIFMMFSGFMITKESAPDFLKWVFTVSPLSYAIQSIFCRMAEDQPIDGPTVMKTYGFRDDEDTQGIVIMVAMVVVFRLLQVYNLKYRNNIQK